MRIAFEDTARPSRIAQALRRHLADRGHRIPLKASREIVGRMFGYASWAELADAPRGQPSLPDHLVTEEERATRRAQYGDALRDMGIEADVAARTVAFVAPTGAFEPGALDGFDFLADPPRAAAALAGADPAAFAATPGGGRLLRALQAAAADDPFWGLRGASRIGARDDAWLAGALDAMRQAPGHPQWPALALVCTAVAAGIMCDDHAHAGDLGPLVTQRVRRGDLDGLAALLADAGEGSLLALVAHVEDILSAQVLRRAPHREFMDPVASFVPSERRPWSPVGRFDLRRPVEGDREWTLDVLNEFGFHPPDAPPSVVVRIADGGGEETGLGIEPARDGLGRDDIVMIGERAGEPACLAVVRVRADPEARLYRLDVEGPRRVGECADATWEATCNFLLAAILARVDGDLRQWGRLVPPGGRLDMLVSPESTPGDGRFVRDLIRTVGDRFAIMQSKLGDLGFDLVVRQADRDGRVRALPPLHVARVPEAAREGWRDFEEAFAHCAYLGERYVLLQFASAGLVVADSGGRSLEGRGPDLDAVVAGMKEEPVEAAIRAIVAEAGLGADAVLVSGVDFTAAVSQAALLDRDWTRGRELCLVVDGEPTEGERERLLNGFWATFRDELDAIDAARAADGLAGAATHPGTASRH